MQLFLDSYGAFLGVRNGQFYVKPGTGEPRFFPVRVVEVIFITRGVSMTGDALILAVENGIPVLLIDHIGHPIAQVWSGQFGSISTIRRNQIIFAESQTGWLWMAETLRRKIENQRNIVKKIGDMTALDDNTLRRQGRALSTLDSLSKKFERWQLEDVLPTFSRQVSAENIGKISAEFRAWEATASRHYFRFIAGLMPERFAFESRSFRPALDKFNSMLNYLYGMLYAYCELALMKTGVDPYIGVLHVDRHARPTMVFDFIEQFRHWADEVCISIAIENTVSDEGFWFDIVDGGILLKAPTKGIVIDKFLSFMEQTVPFKKNNQKRSVVIDMEAQILATRLKN